MYHDVARPIEFIGNQALGKVYFGAGVIRVALTTVVGVPFRSAKQNTQIYESYKNIAYNFMSKVANSDAFTIGEFIGNYFEGAAVGVGYGYALKAAKPLAIKHVRNFKNIKQSVRTVAEKLTEYMDELRKLGGKVKQDFKDDFNHWLGKQEVAVTPEGVHIKVPSQKPKADGLVNQMGNIDKKTPSGRILVSIAEGQKLANIEKNIQWANHNYKHISQKNVGWKKIVKNTGKAKASAKYMQGINVEKLERFAWENGMQTSNGRPWKVMEFNDVVGATEGMETRFMRVEMSSNTIHGHPITPAEFRRLTK